MVDDYMNEWMNGHYVSYDVVWLGGHLEHSLRCMVSVILLFNNYLLFRCPKKVLPMNTIHIIPARNIVKDRLLHLYTLFCPSPDPSPSKTINKEVGISQKPTAPIPAMHINAQSFVCLSIPS